MIDSPYYVISFPGGAGGNWLLYFLYNVPVDGDRIHFHDHRWDRSYKTKIRLEHELDPSKFNFLYSGTAYLNFYLNVMFKFFHWDHKIFEQKSYQEYFLLSVKDDKHCFVNNYNEAVFDFLKKHRMEPIIIPFRHRYFWDGGLHCITLELNRDGSLVDLFPARSISNA